MREDYVTPTVKVTLELMERYRLRKDALRSLHIRRSLRDSEAMDRMALGATDLAWTVMLNEMLRTARPTCSGGL